MRVGHEHERAMSPRLTSQRLELIAHIGERQAMTREVLRDGKLERSSVRGELELARLAELLDDGGVEDEGLHRKAGEVEGPTQGGRKGQQERSASPEPMSAHHSFARSPTRYAPRISSRTSVSFSVKSTM